jgi:carboxyl-terminal processing protease
MDLNENQRNALLTRLARIVEKKFYDPQLNGINWRSLVEERRGLIIHAHSTEEFEKEAYDLLKQLGSSHIGFFHQSTPRGSSRQALAATLCKSETEYGMRWVFQDIHSEGPADLAGVEPGDVLLRAHNREIAPPESPWFAMGAANFITVAKSNGSTVDLTLSVPHPKSLKPPIVVPRSVSFRQLADGIGFLKIAMFPGIVGIDVAKEMTEAVRSLDCDRLVIDLRGNTGGGLGCLRLMSLLCPDKRVIGYTISRRAAERGCRPEELPKFDRIPAEKWQLIPLLLQWAFRDRSVALITEGLGARKFHRHIAILVNEHSASATEMVAAFASENQLAAIIGTNTAGRLMGASAYKLGFGYRVAIPIAVFRTWQGKTLEGVGVSPDIQVPFRPDPTNRDKDPQLEAAIQAVS